jgi:energy-coupling factor transporter ATP-binding protein EcfA2
MANVGYLEELLFRGYLLEAIEQDKGRRRAVIISGITFGLGHIVNIFRGYEALELVGLSGFGEREPNQLSGGQRQQVAVGRALMTQPKLLMLDEPTAGVSPIVMDELFDRIIEVARTGISILMVEQNARQALEIADKGYVLVQGANKYTDTGQALLADPEVRRTFLGG